MPFDFYTPWRQGQNHLRNYQNWVGMAQRKRESEAEEKKTQQYVDIHAAQIGATRVTPDKPRRPDFMVGNKPYWLTFGKDRSIKAEPFQKAPATEYKDDKGQWWRQERMFNPDPKAAGYVNTGDPYKISDPSKAVGAEKDTRTSEKKDYDAIRSEYQQRYGKNWKKEFDREFPKGFHTYQQKRREWGSYGLWTLVRDQMQSAEEVRQAYKDGKLTAEQAEQLLREKFGFTE